MFDFLKAFLPAPVVDIFLPIVLVILIGTIVYRKLSEKAQEHGIGDWLIDKVGGEKLRLWQFEREIKRLKKRGNLVAAARLYEEAEWYPEAVQLYDEAEEYNAAAALHERLEQWEAASEMYFKAEDWKRAATVLTNVGKHAEAARHFEENGQKIDAAKLYADAGELDKAAELYVDVSYFPQAAKCYEKLGQFVKAAENYEEHWSATTSVGGGGLISRASGPESKVALHAGRLYEKGGAPERAVDLYKRAGLAKQSAELAAKQGRFQDAAEMLLKEEELGQAADMFDKAGEAGRAALLRGEIAFQAGELQAAADHFLEGGDNVRAAELYETCENLEAAARCYEQSEAPIQAAGVYLRAGDKARAARMYEQGGDHELAAKLYDEIDDAAKASELYERSGQYYESGRLAERLGEPDRAIQLLQQVDSGDEHHASATLLLARLFLAKQLPGLVVDKLERMLEGQPIHSGNLDHFYCLGLAYEQLGKNDSAVENYRKVLTERYGYEDVEERIARLSGGGAAPSSGQPPSMAPALGDSAASHASPTAVAEPPTPAPAPTPSPAPAPASAATADPGPSSEAPKPAASSPIQIAEKLGDGLLGASYRGVDSRNQQPVTVKLLRSDLMEDPAVLQRFLAEAKVARSLEHPSLVRFLGLIDVNGSRAAVTEFVDGFSLATFIERNKRVSVKQAIDLLARLTVAIGYAHERNLLHRNLKPSNILVAQGGRLKLAGFGLGALRLPSLGRADGYPSPELLEGQALGPSSDIYSLAAVIFEALTGQNPTAETGSANGGPPRLREVLPDAPEALDRVLARCMAFEPVERFVSAEEVAEIVRGIPAA